MTVGIELAVRETRSWLKARHSAVEVHERLLQIPALHSAKTPAESPYWREGHLYVFSHDLATPASTEVVSL